MRTIITSATMTPKCLLLILSQKFSVWHPSTFRCFSENTGIHLCLYSHTYVYIYIYIIYTYIAEYKITVGHRPISGQLTKLTAQNVTWSVFTSEQVSALSLLPRETDRSFMGEVWICAAGVYQIRGAKSVGVASRNRDRSTCHGGKVVTATCV